MISLSSEVVYLSLLGRSVWALLNTYTAVVQERGYYPDTIFIVVEKPFHADTAQVTEGLRIISKQHDFSPEITSIMVDEADIVDVYKKVYALIQSHKKDGASVAIDITPGRKALVAGTLLPITLNDVDHVFYLAISTMDDVARPYWMIPHQVQTLYDFKEQAVRARNGV